jgi:hypothetical protein
LVKDYLVAAREEHRNGRQVPGGKRHAYLRGARTTACGFGLDQMERFADMPFSHQPAAARCPLCARAVRGGR